SVSLKRTALPAPIDRPGVRLAKYARVALYQAVQSLGWRAGDNVLLPGFICNVMAAPFRQLGVEVRYYAQGDRLMPDVEVLPSLVDDRTRGCVVVDYFGF